MDGWAFGPVLVLIFAMFWLVISVMTYLTMWVKHFNVYFCCDSNYNNTSIVQLIDEFVKRKIRSSPRKAWSVFTLASQENTKYSVADFAEDVSICSSDGFYWRISTLQSFFSFPRKSSQGWSDFLCPIHFKVVYGGSSIALQLIVVLSVLFLRTASQFVWQERVYRSFLSSFQQIYDEEGFGGFYG